MIPTTKNISGYFVGSAGEPATHYNKIDIGIFLFILETCLNKEGLHYQRELFIDSSNQEIEKTISAKYKI